jgi:flagellar protein FliS
MFQQTKAWLSYRQVATQTASPGQLVLLLYNGIIRFLEQARLGFALDDPKEFNETINNNIQRAQAIINEMNQSLNMTLGGEFAVRLRSLYDYFDRRLHESNMTKTVPGIEEVLKHVMVLRDAWAEMLQKGAVDPATAALTPDAAAPAGRHQTPGGSLQA